MTSTQTAYRYLIVAPAWVGDMVMAQSLFKQLKQQHPEAYIDVLAPAWSAALTQRMPEIDKTFTQSIGHGRLGLTERYQQAQELKQYHYDQAIVLPNSFKSALAVRIAGIPKRTGFIGEWRYPLLNDIRKLDKDKLTRTVDRFVALAQSPNAQLPKIHKPALLSEGNSLLETATKFNLAAEHPILALCPGAEYGEAKRWPSTHYAEVAQAYIQKGWQVCLLGSEKDKKVGDEILATEAKALNLCGKTNLTEVIDILALSQKVVSNDSGLMHIAAALDKPLIALYGSSDPNFTPPLSPKAHILSLNLDCAPCFKRSCPKGTPRCLADISPDQVLTGLDSMGQIEQINIKAL